MKILVNAISAKKGGILTYTRNLLSGFAARGIDVTVAVPRQFDGSPSDRILRVASSEYTPVKRFVWEQTVWRDIVRRRRPDVLFSSANFGLLNSPVPQVLLLREGGLFDPFYLSHVAPAQGVGPAWRRAGRRRLMLRSARSAERIVTPTRAMRDLLLGWAPELADRCEVNPYGTLGETFAPAASPRPWRDGGALKLLYVSVYYPHKDPAVLVQAAADLCKSGIRTHATLTMTREEIGDTPGGALDHAVVERGMKADNLGMGRHPYRELPALYQEHDVFVFPSVSETFGHPMAEALAAGLPIVAADRPVNREVCGDAALYFEPYSLSGLVARLRELDADPGLRRRMSQSGRERALALFQWDDHVDRLVALFESMANAKTAT